MRPAAPHHAHSDGHTAKCRRCGDVLRRRPRNGAERTLALALASSVPSSSRTASRSCPSTCTGSRTQTTLLTGVVDLVAGGQGEIAALVFLTTELAPARRSRWSSGCSGRCASTSVPGSSPRVPAAPPRADLEHARGVHDRDPRRDREAPGDGEPSSPASRSGRSALLIVVLTARSRPSIPRRSGGSSRPSVRSAERDDGDRARSLPCHECGQLARVSPPSRARTALARAAAPLCTCASRTAADGPGRSVIAAAICYDAGEPAADHDGHIARKARIRHDHERVVLLHRERRLRCALVIFTAEHLRPDDEARRSSCSS